MKVLLVEDDSKISSFVKIGLESHDIVVDVAYDGNIGEELAVTKNYDVLIIDIIIPGISGYDLCKSIRNRNLQTPIILLTSLDSVEDKVKGFESGADDYLTKPFSFQELLARVNALNRRNRDTLIRPVLKIADLEMDSATRTVKRDGSIISLTATEFKILEFLLEHRDTVLDRIIISEKIWGYSFNSGTNKIDVHINSIRNKIDRNFDRKLIHTRKGFGYLISEDT